MHDTRTSRERFAALLFYAAVLLVAYLAMLVVWPFLAPLAWAAILAMTLRPVYLKMCVRLSNGNAALATTTLAAVLIIAPAVFLGSVVAEEIPVALAYLKKLSETTPDQLTQAWDVVRARIPLELPANPVALITEGLQKGASVLLPQAGSLLADFLAVIASLLVMLFSLFFLLRDGRAYAAAIRRLLPFSEQESERLIVETRDLVVASVGAGLIVAAVQGLIGGVTFWALGIPASAVWGVVLAICSLVPVVGATIVWVPVAIWLFFSGQVTTALILTGICAVVLSSVDNVLRPLLLSGRTSASGLVVFIGLLGGASAFGFVGLVIGPIALVTAGTLIDALTRPAVVRVDETPVAE